MKKVFKYPLEMRDVQQIELPSLSEILTVQAQHGEAMLWALVNPDITSTEMRSIRIAGTGRTLDEPHLKYISTFQIMGGSLVFHAFEIK